MRGGQSRHTPFALRPGVWTGGLRAPHFLQGKGTFAGPFIPQSRAAPQRAPWIKGAVTVQCCSPSAGRGMTHRKGEGQGGGENGEDELKGDGRKRQPTKGRDGDGERERCSHLGSAHPSSGFKDFRIACVIHRHRVCNRSPRASRLHEDGLLLTPAGEVFSEGEN